MPRKGGDFLPLKLVTCVASSAATAAVVTMSFFFWKFNLFNMESFYVIKQKMLKVLDTQYYMYLFVYHI